MSRAENDLSRTLETQAEQFARRGGHPLEIENVLARAGEIRRGRRMRATIVMAAAVLAIAVPVGILTTGKDHGSLPTPAGPVTIDRSPITLDDLKTGDAPHTGYGTGRTWHSPDGVVDLSGLPDEIGEVAPVSGGFMVATYDQESGKQSAHFVTSQGDVTGNARLMDGSFAVSAGGDVAAFVQPDGIPVLFQADGDVYYELPGIPRGSGFGAVAVTGEDCTPAAENKGCAVWVQSRGKRPEAWVSTTDGVNTARPEFKLLTAVRDGELVAGMTKITDYGSCSAVEPFDLDEPKWTTCEHQFISFSPDGGHLLAGSAYYDGLGDSRLAVLDSETGKAVIDLTTANEAVVTGRIWEDDSHLLVTVFQQGRWAVLRIGLNGEREYAASPVAGTDDLSSPFVLPSR
jgi:hypothetical protein